MIRILNRAHMKLTIKNLQYGDFGNYRCISKNSLGETEGSIRVYGKRFNYPLACAQYLEMMIICSKTFSSNFASFSVQFFCCCIFIFFLHFLQISFLLSFLILHHLISCNFIGLGVCDIFCTIFVLFLVSLLSRCHLVFFPFIECILFAIIFLLSSFKHSSLNLFASAVTTT